LLHPAGGGREEGTGNGYPQAYNPCLPS